MREVLLHAFVASVIAFLAEEGGMVGPVVEQFGDARVRVKRLKITVRRVVVGCMIVGLEVE